MKREINILISKKEIEKRMREFHKPTLKTEKGVLTKYARLVSQADTGATTN